MKALTFVEVDVPAWVETSPAGDDETWRFAEDTGNVPADFDAIASIVSVSYQPAIISLGEDLGERARVSVTFSDHRHVFDGEPFDQGTFWGKWRGRYGVKLRGRPLRLIRGVVGQSLEEMDTRHFVVESTEGPSPDGKYTIVATDILKFADGDRALAPRPSNGFLVASIDEEETSAILSPAGIGDLQYPASGYVAIGGKEICQFTRSGDTLSLTRAATVPGTSYETEVQAHDAGSRVQLCLVYQAEDPADIIADLFENYAGVPSEYIPIDDWRTEIASFLQTLYTTLIPEPTAVRKLVSELIEQAALALWWDESELLLRLQVVRPIPTTAAVFDETTIVAGSIRTKEQPERRISDVLTYFAQRNPLRPIDEEDNYRSAILSVDAEAIDDYNGRSNKIIRSRWIPFGARSVAERLNKLLLQRFRDPPRRINFDTWRHDGVGVIPGGGYQIEWTANQDHQGNQILAPIQVTRLEPGPALFRAEAQEMLFAAIDPNDLLNRVIIVDSAINDFNLRAVHDSIYPVLTDDDVNASPPVTLTCIVLPNVLIGSTSRDVPAFRVGSFPAGLDLTIDVRGRIQGAGGRGDGYSPRGTAGGPALFTRQSLSLRVADGRIYGGGGGGGRGKGSENYYAGGGGAGKPPGEGGAGAFGGGNGQPGTLDEGGEGGGSRGGSRKSGKGGAPGEPGENGGNTDGFPPGAAIDGISFVTIVDGPGDIRGLQIN